MKKLLGLLAIAPLAIASCTTEAAEAETFTVLLDKDGAEVEYTVEINEHSDYFIDYIFSNQIDVEFELSHSSWGYSVNAIDGVAHSCEKDGYKGSYWQFLEDGTSASFGISSLEPKAGSTYEFNNNGDWCSFDWDSMETSEFDDVLDGGKHKVTGKALYNTGGSMEWTIANVNETDANSNLHDYLLTYTWNGIDLSTLEADVSYDFIIESSTNGTKNVKQLYFDSITISDFKKSA